MIPGQSLFMANAVAMEKNDDGNFTFLKALASEHGFGDYTAPGPGGMKGFAGGAA